MNFFKMIRFQTSEMAFWFVLLTYCILHRETKALSNFIEQSLHLKLYEMLTNVYKKGRLTTELTIKILNCILNIASNNDFFNLFEGRLGAGILVLPGVIKALNEDENTGALKYLNLVSEDFVYLIIKMLFEWDLNAEFKICYLKIIGKILKHSYYNALSCGQGKLVEYLLICLRKEKSEKVKPLVAGILSKILRLNTNISQLKCLLRTVRINYHTLYPNFFAQLIPTQLRTSFSDDMMNLSSYLKSIQLIFGKIIQKVLTK